MTYRSCLSKKYAYYDCGFTMATFVLLTSSYYSLGLKLRQKTYSYIK